MRRFLRQWTCLGTLALVMGAGMVSGAVLAADPDDALRVRVRGGEHKAHSRIVFDWGQSAGYRLIHVGGDIYDIRFDVDADLDRSVLKLDKLKWIDRLDVRSSRPLIVRVDVADNAALRGFNIGTRAVFDAVRGGESAVEGNEAAVRAVARPVVKPAAGRGRDRDGGQSDDGRDDGRDGARRVLEVDDVQARAPSDDGLRSLNKAQRSTGQAEIRAKADRDGGLAGGKAKAEVEAEVADGAKAVRGARRVIEWAKPKDLKLLDPAIKRPNVISISSVSSLSLAAFVTDNKLWLVSGKEDAFISPQVVGDQARDMGAPTFIRHEDAKIVTFDALQGAEYDMTGGGLSWRLLVGQDLRPEGAASRPKRRGVSEHSGRSGEIFWPLEGVVEVVDIRDKKSGFDYKVVTVSRAGSYSGEAYEMVDFDVLPSSLGLAIRPKVDDLLVEAVDGGVVIKRSGGAGLSVSAQKYADAALYKAGGGTDEGGARYSQKVPYYGSKARAARAKAPSGGLMLKFAHWRLPAGVDLATAKSQALASLPTLSREGQADTVLNMARLYMAYGMGAEALGFLRLADQLMPELAGAQSFMALKGVAQALAGHYEDALATLMHSDLRGIGEVRYWQAYVLAQLSDWQQAAARAPESFHDVHYYSPRVASQVALALAEVSLRAGKRGQAREMFEILEDREVHAVLRPSQHAAYAYLKGEEQRQNGQYEEAMASWDGLHRGDDKLYRVRAGLALTRLEADKRDLPPKAAIDRLERLRYAWRGDDLEAQVNYWLGRSYFDDGQFVKGIGIMKESASYATSGHLGGRIVSDMRDTFAGLYMGDKLQTMSAPDAAALFEHYPELVPDGAQGHLMERYLADRLARAHLYDRAIEIYLTQLDQVLKGAEARDAAMKLARLYQLNDAPAASLAMLSRLERMGLADGQAEDVTLLRARGLSRQQRVGDALAMLDVDGATERMNGLRAEIAWQHGYWEDAAEALHFVMLDRGISPDVPLKAGQEKVILQRAVALNLGGDRIRLANLRAVYGDAMAGSAKAAAFEAVTRTHQRADLADRDTLLSVASEIDVFSGFLEAY